MTPEISIVIPTTGSMERLERCINSLVTHSPESFLNHVELIVFLNTREKNLDHPLGAILHRSCRHGICACKAYDLFLAPSNIG